MIGTSLLHYRIVEKLGEGGMGVVYKARDTHLDRFVAIKVMPPEKTADPDRKARFVQEAKAASALNHPNIIHVYDISSDAGHDFIAMEYVAGKTLGELIPRKGMRLGEALKIAVQIADAVSHAHAAGIIHRDLKPANTMVDEHGVVKVLDFGLAKLKEPVGGDESASTATVETAEKPVTERGAIVGTVAYMSPEQAEGKPLDARSDIFSFGSVLYEMLAGTRAFRGGSVISTLSEILKSEPRSIREIVPGLPQDLVRILRQCMRKDPVRRFQNLADVKVELETLLDSPETEAEPVRPRRRIWALSFAMLGALAGAAGTWWALRPRPEPSLTLRRLTFDTGLTTDPAISPDGRMIAYASDRDTDGNLDLWVQQVGGGAPLRLTQDPGDDHEPDFSPDGTRIVFRAERAGGGAYVVSVLGGDAQLLAPNAHYARYSPDGSQIVYTAGGHYYRFPFVAPASGGSARQLSNLTASSFYPPQWSPDGRHVLVPASAPFGGLSTDAWIIAASTSGENGAPVPSGLYDAQRAAGLSPGGVCDWDERGLLVCASLDDSRNLWRTVLHPGTFRSENGFTRLTTGVGLVEHARVARTGRMVLAEESLRIDLWRVSLRTGGLESLTRDQAVESLPSVSADGRLAAFVSNRLGHPDVWIKDLASGKESALTATRDEKAAAVLSPSGRDVYFSMVRDGKRGIYRVPSAGGVPKLVADGVFWPTDVSADDRYVVLQYRYNAPQATVGVLDTGSGTKVENFLGPGYSLYRGHLSPDARWILFHAELARGEARVIIAPFRGIATVPPDGWFSVTDGQSFNDAPRWAADGNSVYYFSERDGSRCVWSQRLDPHTKRPVGDPSALRHFHTRRFSPANVSLSQVDLCVGGESLILNIGERMGNIWVADPGK